MKNAIVFSLSVVFIVLTWSSESQSAAVLESGINVTAAAKGVLDKIKLGKDFRYVVLFVKDEKAIDVEATGPKSATYDDFLKKLKLKTECRYGVYDYALACAQTGKTRDKLVLLSWCPDATKVRTKFVHASSVEGLKRAIPGATFVQAADDDEASLKAVESKLRTTTSGC